MKTFDGHPHERALSLFAGDDLGFLRRLLVERHVARCGSCMATVAGYERLRAELASEAPMPEVDFNALARRIRAAAGTDPPPATLGRWSWKAAAGAALAAAAVTAALFLPEQGNDTTTPAIAIAEPSDDPWAESALFEGGEAQITSTGRLSVRAFHSGSGTLTITDYYAP